MSIFHRKPILAGFDEHETVLYNIMTYDKNDAYGDYVAKEIMRTNNLDLLYAIANYDANHGLVKWKSFLDTIFTSDNTDIIAAVIDGGITSFLMHDSSSPRTFHPSVLPYICFDHQCETDSSVPMNARRIQCLWILLRESGASEDQLIYYCMRYGDVAGLYFGELYDKKARVLKEAMP